MAKKKQTGTSAKQQFQSGTLKDSNKLKSPFWNALLADPARLFLYQKICVFLVAFLVFANGIPNGYNLDDIYYTTKGNPTTTLGIKAIPKIFTTHTLYDVSNPGYDYRPVPALTFALQHQFLGDSPPISHFISVLLYSFICLLTFVLLCYWFGDSKSWLAFFVTLLYAVHPLHTEVVDSIKNRDELLATLFGLLAMVSAWQWNATGKTRHMIFSVLFFITGLLCKTTIIIYAAIIPLAFYFFSDTPFRKIVLPIIILGASYFLFGFIKDSFLPEANRVYLFFENPLINGHQSFGIKTATASYILGWYSYLHVIPYPLSFYYGYNYVHIFNWNNFLPIVSLVPYLLLVFFVVKNIRKRSIAVFGALYYLACISVYSNLFQPAPGMMAERFTFASSLGYSILLVSALYYLYKIIPGTFSVSGKSKYMLATFLFILVSYTAMSISRNTDWRSYMTLYTTDIQHLQNSVQANMIYGDQVILNNNHYRDKYNLASGVEKAVYKDSLLLYRDEEKMPFLRVLAIDPNYNKALNNLGVAYIHEDSLDSARKYLSQARALPPDNSDIHYNLGLVYESPRMKNSEMHLNDSAINEFKKAISLNPKYLTAYWRASQIYIHGKDTGSAIYILRSGISNIPDKSFLYTELAKIYLQKKDTANAIYYYERGAAVSHPDPALVSFLQRYYHSKNNIIKENYYREKANQINP